MKKSYCWLFTIIFVALLNACGGGGGGGGSTTSVTPTSVSLTNPASGNNVANITVSSQPQSSGLPNNVNIPMVSVTVCQPGSNTQCQTIDNVLVDSGSYGLRIFSNQITNFTPSFLQSGSSTVTECVQFADGYTYGPIANLDVAIAGEKASNIPVNIMASPSFTSTPSGCSTGLQSLQSPTSFGSNGVLGIGDNANDGAYGLYYFCNGNTCTYQNNVTNTSSFVVVNPVSKFVVDNNGVIISMPSITAATGNSSASGQLIFGIGTQSNNALPSNANVITPDANNYFVTTLNGTTYNSSFIDSGSNGLFFNTNINLNLCSQNSNWYGFYCPNTTQNLTAQITLSNNTTTGVNFSVTSPLNYPNTAFAFDDLAGTQLNGNIYNNSFDWGLPFFYGKQVFVSISNNPYIAFVNN
ncbi:DUF3443 domain-containing protein [Ferrovum sp. PN-J185]|uniref:DUF3443 family protein n=1 Tax=Ferrovum sp. PN-J185 TaxID=1356306 RepID=UPI00079AA56B|nr:DUF3443 family protein [Ferrovum sp. PN-J185]KXW55294.1 hypothetical protein FV185_18090 [Ferrovum sp. PN-J185]MCC6068641.1 DUF3443 domain-containing protein [Ferrovum sp. PN-J185]MDE1891657.1 DUF3443 family protein [Betaproteobacteria bacterium]MDE2055991.1 DUF3443 family protein [Betaproteobacteria bacterium]